MLAARCSAVRWSVVISAHRLRGEHARAAREQHPLEGQEVVEGGDEAAGTRGEGGRRAPLAVGRVGDREFGPVGPVGRGEPVEVGSRHLEAGVAHAERREDPLGQELGERAARARGRSARRGRRSRCCRASVAGVVQQRQRGEQPHPLVRRHHVAGRGRPLPQLGATAGPPRAGEKSAAEPVAAAEGQQVAHGDRAPRGHHVVDRRRRWCAPPSATPARGASASTGSSSPSALLDEHHRRRGGDRLGDRRDPEDRVARHRRARRRRGRRRPRPRGRRRSATAATAPGSLPVRTCRSSSSVSELEVMSWRPRRAAGFIVGQTGHQRRSARRPVATVALGTASAASPDERVVPGRTDDARGGASWRGSSSSCPVCWRPSGRRLWPSPGFRPVGAVTRVRGGARAQHGGAGVRAAGDPGRHGVRGVGRDRRGGHCPLRDGRPR